MTHDTDDTTGSDTTPVRYDWKQSGQPSVAVVEAVAAATDRTITDLPPLQRRLDLDALDTLLTHGCSPVTVSFAYADTTVTVKTDGTVEVRHDVTVRSERDAADDE